MFKKSLVNTLGVGLSLLLVSSCETTCKDTLYELTEVSMVPRTSAGSGNSIWYNDDALPIDRLIVNIKMVKPVQVLFNPSPDCPVVYKNNNPVISFELISNEDFNVDYPAGKDLFEIATFSNLTQSFAKKEFVDNYVNESNFGTFYFTFTESPEIAEMHSLKIRARFQDGSTIQSSIIPVLLTP
ncbi:hypothetical protein [Cognataquiflexum rubidum]|uniref:hypothetical protein n=1 Tax=Cognataquiflexum rubidum TaxID=2922273 RepID=UPI001F12B808|nr:hypothetical protein [Cognataquiflexum rubidum]MCH6235381.1 hypothetical protein [Cognataquiflexum rubidum]